MSDFTPQGLAEMVAGELRDEVDSLARTMAALMADPQSRAIESRPATMGRRMAVVTAVNLGPPLTADVELNEVSIPGASPQSTYRPQVGDLVWLEFLGSDPHISPPLTTEANRKWNNLTLSNGWSTYVTAPSYWRDPLGMVHLRGNMKSGANGQFATLPGLPDTFRPPIDQVFVVAVVVGTTWSAGFIVVRMGGALEFIGPGAPTAAYLDGITFRID